METNNFNFKKSKKDQLSNTSISVLERMHDRSLFSDVDWNISSYILNHLEDASHLTVKQLSNQTYSSSGSVVRFSKELGYDGFKSFKLALVKDIESKKYLNNSVDFKNPFDLDSSAQSIINSMSSLYKESIDIAQTSLDAKQLERITDLILKSKRLILFGIGDSLITCNLFANKLIKIGILSISATENSDAQCIVDVMTQRDVAIFVTYSAKTKFLKDYGLQLRQKGIPFVTITANANSVLAKLSTETVLFKDMEGSTDEKVATFYSQLVFSFILNSIYSLLYSKLK